MHLKSVHIFYKARNNLQLTQVILHAISNIDKQFTVGRSKENVIIFLT